MMLVVACSVSLIVGMLFSFGALLAWNEEGHQVTIAEAAALGAVAVLWPVIVVVGGFVLALWFLWDMVVWS